MADGGEQIVFRIGSDVAGLTTGAQKGVASLASLEKQAKALEKQVQQIGAAGVEFQRNVNSWAGVTDKVTKSARESAAAFERMADAKDAVDDLRASMDPAYAATLRFQQAALKLDSALDMGAISAEEHADTMALLKARMGDVDGAAVRATGGSRMLMMQLSQVGQQAMATGNIAQALAIQLPDIGLAFGGVGAAAGLLAGIALPMVISAFGDTGKAAEEAQKAMDAMESAVSAYQSAIQAATADTASLREEYALTAAEARNALLALADVERVKAIQTIADSIANLRASMMQQVVDADAFGNSVVVGYDLADSFGMASDQAERLRAAMEALIAANGLDGQAAAARAAAQALRDAYGSVDAMPAPLQAAYAQLVQIELKASATARAAQNITTAFSAALAAASSLQGVVASLSGTIAGAAANAWDMARGLWDAAQAKAEAMSNYATSDLATQYAMYGEGRAAANNLIRENSPTYGGTGNVLPDDKRGGGGGGGSDQLASDLQALKNSLATKEQLEMESWARRQETLQAALEQRLITQDEYDALMLQAQKQHADAMSQIDVYRYGSGLDMAQTFFADMEQAAQAGGGKLLSIAKAFGAAQALISAYQAAAQALAAPSVSPLQQIAAYAKVLATGLGAVSAIKGVSAGGGSGGSSGRSSGGGYSSAAAAPTYNANVTLVGDSFTGDQVANLFQQIQDGLNRGFTFKLARA